MALIDGIIPQQGFEKVKDAIAAILLEELTNQKSLQNFAEEIQVFNERITPLDDAEDLYINVLLDSATYNENNQKDRQGKTMYFIDIYTNGKAGDTNGTSTSIPRMHKFIGMCAYILSSTQYNILALPPGLIGGTKVESFATMDPSLKEDSNYTAFGRLQFSVRVQENQELWSGVDLLGGDTTVKLELTERGFKYIIDN